MLCSVLRNNAIYSINYLNYLNPLKNALTIKNVYPIMKIMGQNKQLQTILKTINYSFISSLTIYPKKIKLRVMDDVTEIAELVKEEGVCKKTEECVMDFEDEFSESESESIEEELDESITIEEVPHKKNYYQHSFPISKSYYKNIVGSKGTMLKRLCSETKTVIRVSKKKKNVVIIGSVQKRIIHAKHRIDELIESSKNKLKYTHFISIPTNTDEMKKNFLKFKEDVMTNIDTETIGFNENMFQKPEKLHLTICMLHLLEEIDQQRAIIALNNCKEKIIEPTLNQTGPLKIELKGLKCMKNNPTKANILYANIHEENGSLQKMSDSIYDYFVQQGLSKKTNVNVTLHMTVINTTYLRNKKMEKKPRNFDATEILKNYADTYFGSINLSTLHISKLTAKSPDGFFEATAKIEF